MKKMYMFFLLILVSCGSDSIMNNDNGVGYKYTDVKEIIEDTASGGMAYACKALRIEGVVENQSDSFNSKNVITLKSYNPNVVFFIRDIIHSPELSAYNKRISEYKRGNQYRFYVFISSIKYRSALPEYEIIAELIIDEIDQDVDSLVFDIQLEPDKYIGKIVELSKGATVDADTDSIIGGIDPITLEDLDNTIYLDTTDKNVYFAVMGCRSPTTRMQKYRKGSTYNFRLFIQKVIDKKDHSFADDAIIKAPLFEIHSIIVWD